MFYYNLQDKICCMMTQVLSGWWKLLIHIYDPCSVNAYTGITSLKYFVNIYTTINHCYSSSISVIHQLLTSWQVQEMCGNKVIINPTKIDFKFSAFSILFQSIMTCFCSMSLCIVHVGRQDGIISHLLEWSFNFIMTMHVCLRYSDKTHLQQLHHVSTSIYIWYHWSTREYFLYKYHHL